MPAWQTGRALGVKVVTVFPGNAARGLSAVQAAYLLLDAETGSPRALMDGAVLTRRRTAAASALAADLPGAARTARRCSWWARARSPRTWSPRTRRRGPSARSACGAAARTRRRRWPRGSIGRACGWPLADGPRGRRPRRRRRLVRHARRRSRWCGAAWLRPGTHLDLVGGFTPAMREADDEAVRRSRVFVDTPAALAEAGDVVQPIARGVLREGGRGRPLRPRPRPPSGPPGRRRDHAVQVRGRRARGPGRGAAGLERLSR